MKNNEPKPWNETPKCDVLHLAYKTCHVCDLQKRVQKLEKLGAPVRMVERETEQSEEPPGTVIKQGCVSLTPQLMFSILHGPGTDAANGYNAINPAVKEGWEKLALFVARKMIAEKQTIQAESDFDFRAHLYRQREFSERTFGPGERTKGVVDHIRKELCEIEAKPLDLSEWIDVVILALDGAWRMGASPEEIIFELVAKQNKNESRSWPDWRTAPLDKAIEHDR